MAGCLPIIKEASAKGLDIDLHGKGKIHLQKRCFSDLKRALYIEKVLIEERFDTPRRAHDIRCWGSDRINRCCECSRSCIIICMKDYFAIQYPRDRVIKGEEKEGEFFNEKLTICILFGLSDFQEDASVGKPQIKAVHLEQMV